MLVVGCVALRGVWEEVGRRVSVRLLPPTFGGIRADQTRDASGRVPTGRYQCCGTNLAMLFDRSEIRH
jgi:hypothetical protein